MNVKQYRGADDLLRLQRFNAEQIAANPMGWLQPGDIPHRLYNGNREHDPADMIRYWEDDAGEIVGWAFAYPDDSFDIQSHDPAIIAEALAWVEETLTEDTLETELWGGEDPRRAVLAEHGYVEAEDELPYQITVRSLHDPIPEPTLPDGFTIRAATGLEDAEKLGEVHAAAFDSDWTTEAYAKVMQLPGYDPAREFVVVAPDGRFAAFTVTWHDVYNKTGYFEPVGTHRDFQRLGLARAVMYHAMRAMREAGLNEVIVVHEPLEENAASGALYESVGFRVRFKTYLYRKERAEQHDD